MLRIAAALALVIFYALHQDWWFWREARPLVFGVLPIGLFYHAAYTVAVSLIVAALFWKSSTRWGALASTLWTAAGVLTVAVVQGTIAAPPAGTAIPVLTFGGTNIITREAAGMMVSALTPSSRPGTATLEKYFPA